MARPVICLGDVMVDVLAQLPGPLALGSDVAAPIRLSPGGSAANTAAWLAALGTPVTLIGRVGDDDAGTRIHRELVAAGITDRLQIDWDQPTGTCIVLVDASGERTMIPDPGANGMLRSSQFIANDFAPTRHLHVSGYALFGSARPAALAALGRARACGMSVSIDAASEAPLLAAGAEDFANWIGTDLLLFANRAEAQVLTGLDDPSAASRRLAARFGRAIVKCGADGAYWSDEQAQTIHAAASKIEHVVDTTGAGDAFAAQFLSSDDEDPSAALSAANQTAAAACTFVGGRPPTGFNGHT